MIDLWKRQLAYMVKRIFWNGKLQRQDLCRVFDVSAAQGSLLLSRLKDNFPGKIEAKGKGYAFIEGFVPEEVGSEVFFSDLLAAYFAGERPDFFSGVKVPYQVHPAYADHGDPVVVRAIVRALQEKKALKVDYVSLDPGAKATSRTIEPVELEYREGRWHLKAYCYLREEWRHFVISRILEVKSLEEPTYNWIRSGGEEMARVMARYVPHRLLTLDQKRVIERQFDMESGILKVRLLPDEIFYFEKRYVGGEDEGPPQKVLEKV